MPDSTPLGAIREFIDYFGSKGARSVSVAGATVVFKTSYDAAPGRPDVVLLASQHAGEGAATTAKQEQADYDDIMFGSAP